MKAHSLFFLLFRLTLVGIICTFLIIEINLNIVTFIGLIMLVGIGVNNGVILIDYGTYQWNVGKETILFLE